MVDIYKELLAVAAKSPCNNRKVGAVIVDKDDHILCSGYNYNPSGLSCEDVAGATESDVLHAEECAIANYFKLPIHNSGEGKTLIPCKMLVTHQPCTNCAKLIYDAFGPDFKVEVIGTFMKFDTGKLRYDLIPNEWHKGDAEILTFGAKKYKPNNWRNVEDIGRYIAALERHLSDLKKAIENGAPCGLFDIDSGLHHMKHLRTNAGFLLTLTEDEKIYEVNREKGLFTNLENPNGEEG
jgi:cytidine deaminase